MAFEKVLRTDKFPRDENVEIHVREVVLNADAPQSRHLPVVEVREFLTEPGVYGHGIILPLTAVKDLTVALKRITREPAVWEEK